MEIESPNGNRILLPRRELFDVRAQLMAEDSLDALTQVAGLDDSDIRTNVYEGGFKSWECSYDLARLLLDRGPRKDLDDLCRVDHVIEVCLWMFLTSFPTPNAPQLGCGTAIPSSVLFQYAIRESLPLYFTFTDYNASVLELVTLPNLILTYVSTLSATAMPFSDSSRNPLANIAPGSHGDLELTPEILDAFSSCMANCALNLTFISGSWAPAQPFLDLIPTSSQMNTLILASETIYSYDALQSFTDTLVGMLRGVRIGKAIVAAKRVYFGVGGSVDAFKVACAEQNAVVADVENHGVDLGHGDGVRRCLLEVQML